MIPRRILTILVTALPLLIVCFSVLMGGYLLAQATEDAGGSVVLRWIATGVLMLIAADIVLLVGVLGFNALGEQQDGHDNPET